jgi:hypothetical protein
LGNKHNLILINRYKFYLDLTIETLNGNYSNCIAKEIQKSFKENAMPQSELCINEKRAFYNYLHEVNKIEHDNLMIFYHQNLIKATSANDQ